MGELLAEAVVVGAANTRSVQHIGIFIYFASAALPGTDLLRMNKEACLFQVVGIDAVFPRMLPFLGRLRSY